MIDTRLGDSVDLEDFALAAAPNLDHPLLAALVAASGSAPRAKLGWTDVSFFSARGVPAANFGPGNPQLAHTAGEWVGRGRPRARPGEPREAGLAARPERRQAAVRLTGAAER